MLRAIGNNRPIIPKHQETFVSHNKFSPYMFARTVQFKENSIVPLSPTTKTSRMCSWKQCIVFLWTKFLSALPW